MCVDVLHVIVTYTPLLVHGTFTKGYLLNQPASKHLLYACLTIVAALGINHLKTGSYH